MTAFTVIVCYIVFLIISLIIAVPLFGLNLSNYSSYFNISDPENVNFLKFMQIIQSTGLFIVPPLILARFFGNGILSYLKLDKKPFLIILGLALLTLFFAMPIIGFAGELNAKMQLPGFLSKIEQWMKNMEESSADLMDKFLMTDKPGNLLLNILMVGIVPAIGEELMFRGLLQKLFTKWTKNVHIGIIIASILFSAMHMQFYGFLPRLLLGLFLGYIFVWSGSLWIPILVHFLYNSLAVVMYFLFQSEIISTDPASLQTENNTTFVIIISTVIVISLMVLMKRKSFALNNNLN
ncbi:lysostaphin resistance A-like protein [Bacteroidota bacterium]